MRATIFAASTWGLGGEEVESSSEGWSWSHTALNRFIDGGLMPCVAFRVAALDAADPGVLGDSVGVAVGSVYASIKYLALGLAAGLG
jgi:hypothetical protein